MTDKNEILKLVQDDNKEQIKTNPPSPILAKAALNQELIYPGAFVVMASECSLVRIRSFPKEGIKTKEEIAAVTVFTRHGA